MLYDDYIKTLSEKIENEFKNIAVEFNFDYGDEFEVALCKILRKFLPIKYGICRGFAVSSDGIKKGDDIIIYDQERFPTLRLNPKEDYSIKEQIPIEAIYAYIEAKHKLDSNVMSKALQQIKEVKILCEKRKEVSIYQHDPHIESDKRPSRPIAHLPRKRNPLFTIIFCRFSDGTSNKKSEDIEDINIFLDSELKKMSINEYKYYPELIIAGNSNFLCTGYKENDITIPTVFLLSEKNNRGFQNIKKDNLAFGIAFAHLLAALDWIRLGKMPWEEIINESKQSANLIIDSSGPSIDEKLIIEFSVSDFIKGQFVIEHKLGFIPQVSVTDKDGEEVFVNIKKDDEKVIIGVKKGFDGKVIIN